MRKYTIFISIAALLFTGAASLVSYAVYRVRGGQNDWITTQEQKAVLLDIGKWLKVNGEAIYGTRCWKKFGEGNTESTKGSFSDNTATTYTAQDMRFTTKGNDFYVIVLNWGEADMLVTSLNKSAVADAQIRNIQLLGSTEKIEWQQTDEGLKLSFPKTKPCEFAYSFKITFDKKVGEHLESEASNEVMRHGSGE